MTFQFVGALVEDDIVEVVVVGGFDDDFVTRRCRPVWRPYLMALAGGWRGILTSRLGVDNLLQDFSFQTNMICAMLVSTPSGERCAKHWKCQLNTVLSHERLLILS